MAFLIAAGAIAARLLLKPIFGLSLPYITLFPAIMFISWYGGLGPALFAVALGGAGAKYFFIPPVYSFRISDRQEGIGWLLFLALSGLISCQGAAVRRSRQRAEAAETELREGQERLRMAFEKAMIGTWDWDIQANRVTWHGQAKRLYGLSTENPFSTKEEGLNLIHPNDRPAVEAAVQRTLTDHVDYNAEFRVIWPDGTVRWLVGRGALFTGHGGEPARMIGINIDVTEQKRIETQLLERSQLIESAYDAIIICDRNRRILNWNRGAQALYGWSATEAQGQLIHELLHTNPGTVASVDAVLRREDRWEGELGHTAKDGRALIVESRHVLMRGVLHEELFLEINRDVTERKRAEAQLEQLMHNLEERVRQRTQQLEEANSELEAFSYSVSHDLRAPLRSIDGFSRLVLEENEKKLDAATVTRLKRVRDATHRMGELIDNLLSLSRVARTPMQSEVVGLSTMAEHIANELHRTNPSRHVKWVIREGLTARGDPRLLRVALENLLANAWKFTSRKPEARIEFSVLNESGETVFYVCDNGAGFSMEYVNKLFTPFQRLHSREEFEGTGIGLATVRRIIKRHGGHIWAEGAVDQGATFYFTIGEQQQLSSDDYAR